MTATKRALAALELLLIFPAALFFGALFTRNLQPPHYEPARTAARVVAWYAARPGVGLWLLLIVLPLVALVTGCAALLRSWNEDDRFRAAARSARTAIREQLPAFVVAAATLTAGGILSAVALHALSD